MTMKAVTDATFNNEVLMSDKPVLVHFWATWSGPCRMVSPSSRKSPMRTPDTLSVVELNVDANPETPRTYKILSVPTMNLYRDGEVVVQIVGAQPKAVILHAIEGYL